MTLGKLKELLDCMTENQLKKEAVIQSNDEVIYIADIHILLDEKSRPYPALVAA
jgi:hypothetical protein